MVGQVVRHEGGDEVVAVVVALMQAQGEGLAVAAHPLEAVRVELGGQKLVGHALIDEDRRAAPAVLHQRAGVVLAPHRPVGAEVAAEGLLAPRAPAGRGDRREGRHRAVQIRMAQGQGERPVAAHRVPEDAAALLINDPQADLSTLDAAAIKTYLENGGHLFVTTDLTVDTPNLDALLAEYGMTRQEGLVIENDSNYYLYGTAQTCLLPNLSSNEITAGVTDGMHVFTPVAQGIVKGDSTDDLTLTTLLSTSSTAYSMQDYAEATTAEQGANDPNGPFNIAVAASNSTTGAKVVWVNCANLLNSKGIEYVAREYASLLIGGNAQLLTSTMNWMIGEENGVVIDSKSMSAETLTVPAKATMLLGLLFTIVVPLAFIVAGIAITLVRRRR